MCTRLKIIKIFNNFAQKRAKTGPKWAQKGLYVSKNAHFAHFLNKFINF